MLLFRILSLAIALLTFVGLYTISIYAPQAVEIASLLLWMSLPVVLLVCFIRTLV